VARLKIEVSHCTMVPLSPTAHAALLLLHRPLSAVVPTVVEVQLRPFQYWMPPAPTAQTLLLLVPPTSVKSGPPAR